MKLITTIIIATMIFWGCNSKRKKNNEQISKSNPIEKIEIKEELEWSELEGFINQFAKTKPNLETGKDTIIN